MRLRFDVVWEEQVVRSGGGADEEFAAGFVKSVEEGDEAAGFIFVKESEDRDGGQDECMVG